MSDPTRTAAAAGPAPTHSVADPAATTGGDDQPSTALSPPASAVRYTLGEEIARGGMGAVYRATDSVLNREVAVKVLQEKYGPASGAARRFADEARITGQLQHPGIPPIHDLGTLPDGRPFLAMKLIKGRTLDQLLAGGGRESPVADPTATANSTQQGADAPRSPSHVSNLVAVFEAICQAVGYAHAHQVIHRDLKPANVMVGAFGEVQVMDWGLAKLMRNAERGIRNESEDPGETALLVPHSEIRIPHSDGSFTQAGSVLGTPAFMSPEQAIGAANQVDARTDVFGLGGILAVILTGKPPFAGDTAETTRQMAARGKVQDCFARLDGCGADPELIALCKRCLAPEKEDRPRDAGEVAAAVETLRHAADDRARRAEVERARAEAQAAEQAKRRRAVQWAAGAVAAVLLLGVAGTSVGLVRANAARRDAEAAQLAEAEERQRAVEARNEADAKRAEADGQRALAAENAAAEKKARELADTNAREMEELIKKFYTAVTAIDTTEHPRVKPVRDQLLVLALPAMERIAAQLPVTDQSEPVLMAIKFQLAQGKQELGQSDAAEALVRECHAIAVRRVRQQQGSDAARNNLAIILRRMADQKMVLRRDLAASLAYQREALALFEDMLANPKTAPDGRGRMPVYTVRAGIADGHQSIAVLYRRIGDPHAALAAFETADAAWKQTLALLDTDADFAKLSTAEQARYRAFVASALSRVRLAIGSALQRCGRDAEAEPLLRAALDEVEGRYQKDTSSPAARLMLAGFLYIWGEFLTNTGRAEAAGPHLVRAVELAERLLKDDPDNIEIQRTASVAYSYLARQLEKTKPADARAAWERCVQLREGLARRDPKNDKWQMYLMAVLPTVGQVERAAKLADQYRRAAAVDNEMRLDIAVAYARCATATEDPAARERYAAACVDVLAEAVKHGYRDAVYMTEQIDAEPVRTRADFKALVESIRQPRAVVK